MARYTAAYSSFVSRLDEVRILQRYGAAKEKEDPIALRDEINALARGAVVLLCGHLEAYVKELGEIALESMTLKNIARTNLSSRFYYHISRDLLEELDETSDPEKIADKIFAFLQSDLVYWSKVGPFPQQVPSDRFNMGFASPGFRKLKKIFQSVWILGLSKRSR